MSTLEILALLILVAIGASGWVLLKILNELREANLHLVSVSHSLDQVRDDVVNIEMSMTEVRNDVIHIEMKMTEANHLLDEVGKDVSLIKVKMT
jgi:hypothetical protein